MIFNREIAQAHLDRLLTEHKISVLKYSASSCGRAYWAERAVKIPQPTTLDRFCVCLHEVKHILDGNVGHRFQQEFDADFYAMEEAKKLGFETESWKPRMRWHCLSRIAMAMNRKMPAGKIPKYIKDYFSDVNFYEWERKKVFVSADRKFQNIKITIN